MSGSSSGSRGRRSRSKGGWGKPVVLAMALVAAAVLVWFVLGRSTPPPSPAPDFGALLYELAAARGADPDGVVADEPIRKIDGVFVRSWQIAVPNPAALAALEQDISAAASSRGAMVTRQAAASPEAARVRVDLGAEAFDVVVVVTEPRRVAQTLPTPTPKPPPTATPRPRPAPDARGRLAIVLDDAGQSDDLLDSAASLPAAVGIAVLPFLPHSEEIAQKMHQAGHEVWLHLPMEPQGYPDSDPGPGAIFVAMADSEIRTAVHAAINAVPHAVGVNNHMGSRATADLRVMTWVMQEIGARGLAFIDSRTTRATVAEEVARTLGVPCGRRHVFLDNQRSATSIRSQLEEAVETCRLEGAAIAIGHLDPMTVQVLAEELPGLSRRGADLVRPTSLLR